MQYHDMVIEAFDAERKLSPGKIWQISFNVRVLSSPQGEMSPEQAVPVHCDEAPLQAVLVKLESSDLEQAGLVALGRTLAGLLLPPGPEGAAVSVRELLKGNLKGLGPEEGVRLRLRLPPMLAALPWEYIYVDRAGGGDGMDGFLALDPRVAIVRHEVLAAPVALPPLGGDIKIVTALASAAGLPQLNLEQERADLEEAFKGQAGIIPQFLPDVTLDELQGAMPGAGIFHFAGHGAFERKMSDLPGIYTGEGALALFDQMVPAEQLGINLRGNGVRLAVLGGCETGRRAGISVWSGIAPALVKAEIPAVVGNQYAISDKCAIAFSRQLYRALVGGLPVERAVSAGRIAAYNVDKASRDWGVPVLYLRAGDGQLFAGAADEKVRVAAKEAAEVDVDLRIREVAAGGEVFGAEVRQMLSGKLAVQIVIAGSVYGTVHGATFDQLGGGRTDVDLDIDTVGPGGKVTGVVIDSFGGTRTEQTLGNLKGGSATEERLRSVNIEQTIGNMIGGSVTGERLSNVNIENLVIQTSETDPNPMVKPEIEEKIRVDVAAPEKVLVEEVFEIAVAIRRPESPVLTLDDLSKTFSGSGTTFRSEPGEIIRYRVTISAPDCLIHGPSEYVFLLRPSQDSEPFFFQLAARKAGRISILVQAYQEGGIVAATTRLQIKAYVEATN